MRAYNFAAGPAALPDEVLEQARAELLNWEKTGASVLEIGHRTEQFMALAEQSKQDLRELMAIPKNYQILFLAGGGQHQFAMVPLNLLGRSAALEADYIDTGIWSHKAIVEAERYGKINIAANAASENFERIPDFSSWRPNPNAAYLHYAQNETIGGLEFPYIPEVSVPLVTDMTSSILSEPLDVSRFGIIYAGAQKNISAAGLTIVIIRDDLLNYALPFTPTIFTYKTHAEANSLFNTPPVFAWYLASLVFAWLKRQGGVKKMGELNREKSSLLYSIIDNSNGFYRNKIDHRYRSRMNVPFNLATADLEHLFIKEAASANLINLKGHKLSGGIRASLYNAVTLKATQTLGTFMQDFAKRYG